MKTGTQKTTSNQSEKIEKAARDLECDEDEARWSERLKKVAQQKPGKAE